MRKVTCQIATSSHSDLLPQPRGVAKHGAAVSGCSVALAVCARSCASLCKARTDSLWLRTGLVAREAVSVYKIPSRSMEPTILSGDLLLVEKVSPKVGVKPKSGEIVLFTPPPRLKEVVAATGGRVGPRDLFVKRVAATPGDRVRVDRGGNAYVNGEFYAEGQQCNLDFESDLLQNLIGAGGAGGEAEVPRDTSYVLGDCGDVSVDSRVWGPLEDAKVIGRPILRLWPPARFGPIADL